MTVFFSACNKDKTFSQLQDEEQVVIQNYIQKNNIQVVTEKPKSGEWGENVYYKSISGLYFHLIDEGVKTDSVRDNVKVGYRYVEYDLDDNKSVRLRNWEPRDRQEPVIFIYGSSEATNSLGVGIHEAIGLMKYKSSEAMIIVPAGLNTSAYSESREKLYPVSYHLKITVIK